MTRPEYDAAANSRGWPTRSAVRAEAEELRDEVHGWSGIAASDRFPASTCR